MKKSTIAIIGFILTVIAVFGISWFVTCGIVNLLSWCFGFTFTWKLATGVWVIWLVLAGLFGKKRTVKVEE